MAIDGTWRRSCTVKEVSDNGAILEVETSVQGLSLIEFFLVLSSRGLAYRRCQLEKVNGPEMEVRFLRQKDRKKRTEKTDPDACDTSGDQQRKAEQVRCEFVCAGGGQY